MIKALLDTNILVKFAFISRKRDKKIRIPKYLKKFKELLDLYETSRFSNVMSQWNKLELRDVLMHLKFKEICFLDGYTVDEFSQAIKEGIELKKEHIEGINEIVFDIWKFSERTTKEMDMRKIEMCTKKDFSCMDMILLHQAELNECTHFVTEDRKLRFSENLKKFFKVKICCVNEFKEEVLKKSKSSNPSKYNEILTKNTPF